MQQIIKEQTDQIKTLQHSEKKARETLEKTNEILDKTNKRLDQSLEDKRLNNKEEYNELSDVHRPTRLAEMFQTIYDNEWAEAFECITKMKHDDEESVALALFDILLVIL
ncbi:uncharacterized protein LOC132760247 [Ruditapes philippinarum]|uniref:uncharacterized protein LOC132760247 n=1 Tax=Ruditapes philippinarum TaxID=129788 RepID=UPI00295B652C|nr:uncharacterized protein LOC132760247 [Ruditapes philippinarum]